MMLADDFGAIRARASELRGECGAGGDPIWLTSAMMEEARAAIERAWQAASGPVVLRPGITLTMIYEEPLEAARLRRCQRSL